MFRENLKYLFFATLALFGLMYVYPNFEKHLPSNLSDKELIEQEILYLPSGDALKFLSVGYHNAFADFFWFTTINYFGKHFHTDKSYQWLAHRCGLIQELDPHYEYVPEFCALILSFEARDSASARIILRRAAAANPENWRFYYLIGMNYLMFDKDPKAARDYFIKSAKMPNALPFVARLAARQSANLNQPEVGLEFLSDMIKNARSKDQRQALVGHYLKTLGEVRISTLERYKLIYEQRFNRVLVDLRQLSEVGLSQQYLVDPVGAGYYIDPADRKIKSRPKVVLKDKKINKVK
jgi:hypothetical protein